MALTYEYKTKGVKLIQTAKECAVASFRTRLHHTTMSAHIKNMFAVNIKCAHV